MIKNNLFEFDKGFSSYPSLAEGSKSIDFGGGSILIGTDEAGRGPGAGGVFASAVCFNNTDKNLIEKLSGLNDSKKLSKKKREELYDIILENTINSTICIEVEEIEKINILNASLKAMKLACENVIKLCPPLEGEPKSIDFEGGQKKNILILVDGNKQIKDFYPPPNFSDARPSHRKITSPSGGEGVPFHASRLTLHANIKQQCIIKGDAQSASIAAASILAKVTRDRYMEELDKKFPQYNWKQNAGYLTAEHFSAIEKYGITPHHRKSFLKKFESKQLSLI